MRITINNSDHIGVIASGLCMLHCFATPILFLSQASLATHEVPVLWSMLNYIFLIVSFFAVYRSAQNSSNLYVKVFLFIAWACLTGLILNEEFEIFSAAEAYTYLSAITLCGLHIYNLKYCNCKDDDCCANPE